MVWYSRIVRTGRPARLSFEAPPGRLTGGFWAELISFRLRGAPDGWRGDLVARVMPSPDIAAKETAIQTEVSAQGFPTPAVHLAGGPGDGLGRAFMVMDLAAGGPLLGGLGGVGAIAALPRLPSQCPACCAPPSVPLAGGSPGASDAPTPVTPPSPSTLQRCGGARA